MHARDRSSSLRLGGHDEIHTCMQFFFTTIQFYLHCIQITSFPPAGAGRGIGTLDCVGEAAIGVAVKVVRRARVRMLLATKFAIVFTVELGRAKPT